MSVSETPKSRLETISFPGPEVVKAAGLIFFVNTFFQVLNLQVHTCPAWLQVDPGSDHAAIASSCSSPQTCKVNIFKITSKKKNLIFWGLSGHMYLLVIMTEATLWLHTLHILTVSNHPTAREEKRKSRSQPTCSYFARRHPYRPVQPQLLFLEEQQQVHETEICFAGQPVRIHNMVIEQLFIQFSIREKRDFLTWAEGPLLLLLALPPPPFSWLRPREADLPRTWPLNNASVI